MTIHELFAQVDDLKPNQYDDSHKLIWLNDVEGRIQREIFKINDFENYTKDYYDRELIAEKPYDNLYRLYIMLMIDYTNAEFTRYAQSLAMFNNAYAEYSHYVNRTYHEGKSYLKLF